MVLRKNLANLVFTILLLNVLGVLLSVNFSITYAQDNANNTRSNITNANNTAVRNSNAGNANGISNQNANTNVNGDTSQNSNTNSNSNNEISQRAEIRKDKLANSNWYFFIVTVMFGVLLIPFMLIIFRAIKYSSATYRSPLGLPDGSLRAVLAYTLVTFLGFYILASILSVSEFKPPDFLLGIIATVIGFYFGSRTGEERGNTVPVVGNIQGIVVDKNNTPVTGASVDLLQYNGKKLTQITDVSGKCKFDNILIGDYEIQASLTGHQPSDKQKVKVKAGETLNIDLKLK